MDNIKRVNNPFSKRKPANLFKNNTISSQARGMRSVGCHQAGGTGFGGNLNQIGISIAQREINQFVTNNKSKWGGLIYPAWLRSYFEVTDAQIHNHLRSIILPMRVKVSHSFDSDASSIKPEFFVPVISLIVYAVLT